MLSRLPKEKVRAVHDEDLETIFEGLGVLNKFKRGELVCKFCRTVITFDNLHSFFPQSGDIKFVCTSPKCMSEIHRLLREGEISL